MLHDFTFNGRSAAEMSIYIGNKSGFDIPKRSVEKVSVPGRNGDIIIDNGCYENIKITYHALLDSRSRKFGNQAEHLRKVKAWLSGGFGRYCRLSDTYDNEAFRLGAFVDVVNIKRLDDNFAECDIAFDCVPLRYLYSGENPVAMTEDGSIYNPTDITAKPIIKINAEGSVTLSVNGKEISINDISNSVTLDCAQLRAIDVDNYKVRGIFPEFAAGNNDISFSGATSIEIIPRWCCL